MEPCPSAFAWDDHDIHGTAFPAAVARHVGGCARCRSVEEHRQASARAFAARVAAPLRQRLASVRTRGRWRWRWHWIVPSAATLAAVGVLLTIQLRGPAPGLHESPAYTGVKGAVSIEVAGRRSGRVFELGGDVAAATGDEVQLTVRAAAGLRYVLVGSVDGTGRFSAFYPASLEGQSLELPPAGRPLAPPVVLDGAPGPERIAVVLSRVPLPAKVVARWAEAAAEHSSGPAGTSAPNIPGAAAGEVVVRWITLPKAGGAR
jgi:hypothetical protein